MKFVNVYEVGRSYGGPEEGGWYYSTYYPLASVPFGDDTPHEIIEAEQKRLTLLYGTKRRAIWVEAKFAQESSESPIYE
jgi:hypothetical protein